MENPSMSLGYNSGITGPGPDTRFALASDTPSRPAHVSGIHVDGTASAKGVIDILRAGREYGMDQETIRVALAHSGLDRPTTIQNCLLNTYTGEQHHYYDEDGVELLVTEPADKLANEQVREERQQRSRTEAMIEEFYERMASGLKLRPEELASLREELVDEYEGR